MAKEIISSQFPEANTAIIISDVRANCSTWGLAAFPSKCPGSQVVGSAPDKSYSFLTLLEHS